ncbi:MAG: hypothetical protein KDJ36_18600, partial [Hyphomicrobiaceae bacterium]|nr:hypothetical protein [Hyphomicrobiaceae bacterium]
THYFAGGMATVGENGPENVFLPKGSRIITASETRRMNGSGAANDVHVTVSVEPNDSFDARVVSISKRQVEAAAPGIVQQSVQTTADARQRRIIS